MRIWDIDPSNLCRQHLLGEHRELHGLFNILDQGKTGYNKHPETLRWVGKLGALWIRHEKLVREMTRRGYAHKSIIDRPDLGFYQDKLLLTQYEQINLLKQKGCDCACT